MRDGKKIMLQEMLSDIRECERVLRRASFCIPFWIDEDVDFVRLARPLFEANAARLLDVVHRIHQKGAPPRIRTAWEI